jgi:hypothetical protein
MAETIATKLKAVVHYREFPFGTASDPSMRQFMAAEPWEHQAEVLSYLRSGYVLGIPMSADLPDWFDSSERANPMIDGRREGGVTPMTDGVWFWPAGLIHFIEKYNVCVPQEFIDHAASQGWRVNRALVSQGSYEYDY